MVNANTVKHELTDIAIVLVSALCVCAVKHRTIHNICIQCIWNKAYMCVANKHLHLHIAFFDPDSKIL